MRTVPPVLEDHAVPPLIAVAALVLDFLCIHPFRDGNGRVSRLLNLLALCHHGYDVGRYVSLERLIEESREDYREDYYECLHRSSDRWHQCRHELTPWFNFILAIIWRAYAELEDVAGNAKAPRGTKAELVLAAIRAYQGEFRLMDLQRDCPGVGRDWIRTILANLKKSGDVACSGPRRRNTVTIWLRTTPFQPARRSSRKVAMRWMNGSPTALLPVVQRPGQSKRLKSSHRGAPLRPCGIGARQAGRTAREGALEQ